MAGYNVGSGAAPLPAKTGGGGRGGHSATKCVNNTSSSAVGLVDGQVVNAAAKATKHIATAPAERTCIDCKQKHTHLYRCEKFQAVAVGDRYIHCIRARVCFSCLRMDSDVKQKDMTQWCDDYQVDCNLEWVCAEDCCATWAEIR